MKGLIIKSPWIEHVLAGKRTWEIRGSLSSTRGRIALVKSRSGCVVGTCQMVDCIGPLTLEDLRANADKHQIPVESLAVLPYARTYAWVLSDVKPLAQPIPYKHPAGAVVWVKIGPENVPSRFNELEPAAPTPAAAQPAVVQAEAPAADVAAPGVETAAMPASEAPKVEVTVYATQPAAAEVKA